LDDGSKTILQLIPSEVAEDEGGEAIELPVIPADDRHRNYIIGTWVNSHVSSGMCLTEKDIARAGESKLAEDNWHNSVVVVSPADEFTIHAWICLGMNHDESSSAVLYIYVPPDLRNCGIAKELTEFFCGKEYEALHDWPKTPKGHKVHFNPYLGRKPIDAEDSGSADQVQQGDLPSSGERLLGE
jgi:hypothetical protein